MLRVQDSLAQILRMSSVCTQESLPVSMSLSTLPLSQMLVQGALKTMDLAQMEVLAEEEVCFMAKTAQGTHNSFIGSKP